MSEDLVADAILFELMTAEWQKGGSGVEDRGAIRDDEERPEEEEEALRLAERMVYGWPNKNEEPTGACSRGRFVRSFPLEFPMGVGDLHGPRPRVVTPQEHAQHMLPLSNGQCVGGARQHRLVWALVNGV